MNPESSSVKVNLAASLVANRGIVEEQDAPYIEYSMECVGPDGAVKWTETFRNAVTRVGAADLLDKYFANGTNPATWYLGLIGSTSYTTGPATTDTAASHGGWVESVAYSQATRPALSWSAATTASNNVDKVASAAASFTINGSATIKGCFTITNNAKSGTSGVLYSAGTFTDRVVESGDTLNVTPTLRVVVS